MLWKNRNKKVGLCVMVVMACLVLAAVWLALATPETALAGKPGGNVEKQDIPAILTFGDTGDLTSDSSGPYSDSENGTSCAVGRRRSIWVNLSKNSPRSMSLTLVNPSYESFGNDPEINIGDDPLGDPTGIVPPTPPNGTIYQVELKIAEGQNVSGLGEEIIEGDKSSSPVVYTEPGTWDIADPQPYDPEADPDPDPADYPRMLTNMRLIFLDGTGDQWGIFFGPGYANRSWGGGRFFTNVDALYVHVERTNPNKWTVDYQYSQDTLGFLWYKGSNKNAPWVYVGKYNVPWSCTVDSL